MKINLNNTEKVQSALEAANGKCSTRTVDIDKVRDLAKTLDRKLEEIGLSKKHQVGSKIEYYEQIHCNNYSGSASSTRVVITKGSNAQFLTHCDRERIWARHKAPAAPQIFISDKAVEYLKSKITNRIS